MIISVPNIRDIVQKIYTPVTHSLHLNGHCMGHITPYPLIFTIGTHNLKHCLGYFPSSVWFYNIRTHFFPSPRVACHCDHVLIYPQAATEWPQYGPCCPLPFNFHYRDPQIETLPWVPHIFNMVYHIGTHFFPSPWVACHCDHVLIYSWAATEWPLHQSCCPLPSYFHFRDPQIETLPWVPPAFNMVLSH